MTDNHGKRCSPTSTCPETSICVTYTSSNPLLRIEISKNGELKTVLWSGPPLEVWEQGELFLLTVMHPLMVTAVEVGELRPRAFVYPLWLPKSLASYMSCVPWEILSAGYR